MVYCKLIKETANTVIYAFGGFADDLTGELLLFKGSDEYEVIKQPKNSKVYKIHIERMLRIHHEEFQRCIFKEKLAYEI